MINIKDDLGVPYGLRNTSLGLNAGKESLNHRRHVLRSGAGSDDHPSLALNNFSYNQRGIRIPPWFAGQRIIVMVDQLVSCFAVVSPFVGPVLQSLAGHVLYNVESRCFMFGKLLDHCTWLCIFAFAYTHTHIHTHIISNYTRLSFSTILTTRKVGCEDLMATTDVSAFNGSGKQGAIVATDYGLGYGEEAGS